jgi:hypothetical protein
LFYWQQRLYLQRNIRKRISGGQEMSDLKPCPFCGSDMVGMIYHDKKCYLRMVYENQEHRNVNGCDMHNMTALIEAWNTRTDPGRDEMLEALIKITKHHKDLTAKCAKNKEPVCMMQLLDIVEIESIIEKETNKKIEEVI